MPVLGGQKRKSQLFSLDPFFVILEPVNAKEVWSARMEGEVVTLLRPDHTPMLTVPREQVARHVRFYRDLFRGRTVAFVVVKGLKSYLFHCSDEDFEKLSAWMPQKSPEEVREEVRLTGATVALFGVLVLLLRAFFAPGWGVGLLVAGIVGIAVPRRYVYILNGLLMFLFGFAQLFAGEGFSPGEALATADVALLHPLVASLFLCWGIQQFSMLSLNAQIRVARIRQGRKERVEAARPSALVRAVGTGALGSALLFELYALGLYYASSLPDSPVQPVELATRFGVFNPDLGVFVILGLVAGGAGALMLARGRASYREAKVTGQLLVVSATFLVWGLIFGIDVQAPLSVFGPVLSTGGWYLSRPYVLLSLILAVLLFNRWFAKRLDRELQED